MIARDIAEFAARILTDDTRRHDGAIDTPTGPESLSFTDVAARLSQLLDKPVEYLPESEDKQRATLLRCGVPPWVAEILIEYARVYATGWADFTTGDLTAVVGHEPRVVDDFLRDHRTAFT